jgi:hypothetical protein
MRIHSSLQAVGDVPLEWYKDEDHVGYDREGRKIAKAAGRKDMLTKLLDRNDSKKVSGMFGILTQAAMFPGMTAVGTFSFRVWCVLHLSQYCMLCTCLILALSVGKHVLSSDCSPQSLVFRRCEQSMTRLMTKRSP